jgi:hypothetical protein
MTMFTRSKTALVIAALLSTASAPFATHAIAAVQSFGFARGAMSVQQPGKKGAQAYAAEPTSRNYKANAMYAERQQPGVSLRWIDDSSSPGG